MNKITEKYFTHKDFSPHIKRALKQVIKRTGFESGKEIFRGRVLDKTKVGSVIFSGIYYGKPAALKLQGLRPEIDEVKIMRAFDSQNKSKIISVPKVYEYLPFSKSRGFGYIISEFIIGKKIYGSPFAKADGMKEFANFYNEFRRKALRKNFLEIKKPRTFEFIDSRLGVWLKYARQHPILRKADYLAELGMFYETLLMLAPKIPMVFCHGHLSPDDIIKTQNGQYIILSNLFWQYRPKYYDLAFNTWSRIQQLASVKIKTADVINYISAWQKTYKNIKLIKQDRNFERNFIFMLLERCMGAMLVDLAVDLNLGQSTKAEFEHIYKVHKQVFKHLFNRLSLMHSYRRV